MATTKEVPLACGNWVPGSVACGEKGKFACGNCNLLSYCGKECQKTHWPVHKTVCKSRISKTSWRPAWDTENRKPAWAKGDDRRNMHNPFGGDVFLWGNVPAIDILRLCGNEGPDYKEEIELLFAASGDLRNVVKTIADLPAAATQRINVTINDREFAVVARNVILLLFALSAPEGNPFDTAEALIHLWYSAFIPAKTFSALQDTVKHLIADVCDKIETKDPAASLEKTWEFPSGRSLRLVLTQDQWLKLEKVLDMPQDLTYENARSIRHGVTLAPDRADYRDRWDFKEPTPFKRVARRRFREDGLLLPFGHSRIGFDTPNFTLFQNAQTWLMDDKSDPLDGWPIWEVLRQPWIAKEDCYGKLYAYIHSIFQRFLDRLASANVSFEMHCVDAKELKNHLPRDKYTRIETSNISDRCHVGIHSTLRSLSLLLQPPQRNPHATLITLFLNAVIETVKQIGANEMANSAEIMRYFPDTDPITMVMKPQGAEITCIFDSRTLFFDVDEFFQILVCDFEGISSDLRVAEKESNTIVEKWLTRLERRQGQEGAQDEFRVVLGSSLSGMERYVEWKRVD